MFDQSDSLYVASMEIWLESEGLEHTSTLAAVSVAHIIIFFRGIEVRKYNFSQIKTKIKFVFSNYLNNLTGMIGGQVDKLAIGGMFGFTLLGHYSLAIQVITMMM